MCDDRKKPVFTGIRFPQGHFRLLTTRKLLLQFELGPPQCHMRIDPRQHFFSLKGLGNIIHVAHGKPADFIFDVASRAEKNYRNNARGIVRLQLLYERCSSTLASNSSVARLAESRAFAYSVTPTTSPMVSNKLNVTLNAA
jgi:hypothetical protein